MPVKMKMVKDFNLKKIKLDVHRELNDAIVIIAKNIEHGIKVKKQFGQPFTPNAESTELRKGFNHRLKEFGDMMDSRSMQFTFATKAKQVSTLLPVANRIDAAFYNHFGTSNIPETLFWGISKQAELLAVRKVEEKINRLVDNA